MNNNPSISLLMNLDLAVQNLKMIGALKEDCNIDDVKTAISTSITCVCNAEIKVRESEDK